MTKEEMITEMLKYSTFPEKTKKEMAKQYAKRWNKETITKCFRYYLEKMANDPTEENANFYLQVLFDWGDK